MSDYPLAVIAASDDYDPPPPWAAPDFLKQIGHKRVFDPAVAAQRLAELAGNSSDAGEGRDGAAGLWLQRMAQDERSGFRAPLMPGPEVADAIAAIGAKAPNFHRLTEFLVRRIQASINTNTPLQPPPILLAGPPGVGKTYVSQQIAAAVGSRHRAVSMVNETSINVFAGVDRTWRSPRIGLVARLLVEGDNASPLVLLDEIDKALKINFGSDPLDPLHALLEPMQAAEFRDNFLELEVCADSLIWIATANDVTQIPGPIRDRLLVLHIDPPTSEQMGAVIAALYGAACQRYAGWFEPELATSIVDLIRTLHPRRARRLLDEACVIAAARESRALSRRDVEAALALQADDEPQRRRIGFR